MPELLIPVVTFTGLVFLLALFVLVARRRLAPHGFVDVVVNGERTIRGEAGRRLLWVLAEQGVLLPAACGGRGACGQCRVRVEAKHSWPTAMERMHITASQAEEGGRLACMVKLRENLAVQIPGESLRATRWACEVRSNRRIAPLITHLTLDLPPGQTIDFDAGAYVLVEARPYQLRLGELDVDARFRDAWERLGVPDLVARLDEPTTRAYSLANPPQQDDRLDLLVRLATPPPTARAGTPPGQVSPWIFALEAGESVSVSGPFGEFRVQDRSRDMVLVAGGVGIAPLRSIILDQLARDVRRTMSLWYGARTRDDLCFHGEFAALARSHANFRYHPTVSEPREDGGWSGNTGFVHRVLFERYLERHPSPADLDYYVCGPPVMSAAVLDMLAKLRVPPEQIHYDDFGQ